ncbi:hypothetical protein, partial [Pseudomonas sp. NPDC089569]|uniref:hypothetical protein n=1 Tax=Pseudomonas sp. NPDC089569 TaxID=3390722 RepID=UPI003D016830
MSSIDTVQSNQAPMIKRVIEVFGHVQNHRSLDAALDGLLEVGRIIGLPNPAFIDNVVHEQRHESIQASLGVPAGMLCWWHEQRISVKQRDVQQARRERMPFVSSLL